MNNSIVSKNQGRVKTHTRAAGKAVRMCVCHFRPASCRLRSVSDKLRENRQHIEQIDRAVAVDVAAHDRPLHGKRDALPERIVGRTADSIAFVIRKAA